ncbi:MAG TPA: tetratricopeptide repeat protein, partial [Blastocatellia bacterium]
WRILKRSAPYAIATGCYLAWRYHVLHGLTHDNPNMPLGTMILTMPSVLWFYLKLLLFPSNLSLFYDFVTLKSISLSGFVLPLIASIAAGVLLVWAARKSRVADFGLALLVLPILPVLNLRVLQPGNFVHDRYLYLSSVGLSILMALGLRSLGAWIQHRVNFEQFTYLRSASLLRVVPVALIGVLGVLTAYQSRIWENEIVLYQRAIAIAPDSLAARNNLAAALGNHGKYQEAADILSGIVAMNPDSWIAAYNLAMVYEHLGQFDYSEMYYDRAIQIDPTKSHAFYQKAAVKLDQGKLDEAESLARQAIATSPDEARYHELLGVVLERESKYAPALEQFKLELEKHPEETGSMAKIKQLEEPLKTGSEQSAAVSQ